MTLKTYWKDWKENGNAFKRRTDDIKKAKLIVNKLRRHFKVPGYNYFTKTNGGGFASTSGGLTFSKRDISLGVINHEIAHLVALKRYGTLAHDKKFKRALKIVNNYVKKKYYFDKYVDWNFKYNYAFNPKRNINYNKTFWNNLYACSNIRIENAFSGVIKGGKKNEKR
jgi:predicted SprT family Zn-dependent metalloprotease|tara:strand:- start:471 stop:974 length:504 start_codon:yes stop_codon:yes gene_type:complete